jgi:uridine kinase
LIEVALKKKRLLIGTIYRPPDMKADYWPKLRDHLELAKDTDINTIVLTGDLNCNLLNPKTKLGDILEHLNMEQIINEPTHYTDNNATLIDIVATTSADLIEHFEVTTPSLSNHCDLSILINIETPKNECFARKVYKYTEADWAKLKQDIKNYDWEAVLRLEDINEQAKVWTEEYTKLIDKNIPNNVLHLTQENKEWMNNTIKKLRKKKSEKHKRAQKSGKDSDWRRYREVRDNLNESITEAKNKYNLTLANKIRDSEGKNEKLWWKLAKRFYNKTSNNRHQNPPLLVNGKTTSSNKEKAEVFNRYFSEASNINEDPNLVLPEVLIFDFIYNE